MKRLILLLVLLVGGLALWWRRAAEPIPAPAPPVHAEPEVTEPREPAYYPPLDQLNSPQQTVQHDLKILRDLFIDYQITVKDPSGNPAGTHEEIVAALQGRNRARLAFLPAQHPTLNNQGQLIDRWGTPYFFHALSGTRMEIRSAGPDRKMYTDDDALLGSPPSRP